MRAGPGPMDPVLAARAARHGLGLSEEDARRLPERLPLVLALRPQPPEVSLRLKARLAAAGFGLEARPTTVDFAACPTHPKLAASEPCPKCKEQRACAACLYLIDVAQCAKCRKSSGVWRRFRHFRIAVLLAVLGFVALGAIHRQRQLRSWITPISVLVFPIAATEDETISSYLETLEESDLAPVEAFFAREAERLDAPTRNPLRLRLGPRLEARPPRMPESGSPLEALLFSLKLRWYAWRAPAGFELEPTDLQVFWVLHAANSDTMLDHSVGLEGLQVAVVHGFAADDMLGANHVVIAHELLHLVGATDKYEPTTGTPTYPGGYAEPSLEPLYPQTYAELMGGRIPLAAEASKMPKDLSECRIAEETAREILWVESSEVEPR